MFHRQKKNNFRRRTGVVKGIKNNENTKYVDKFSHQVVEQSDGKLPKIE